MDDLHAYSTVDPGFAPPVLRNHPPLITVRDLNLWYGAKQALEDVSFEVFPNEILAFIGPSGCGKTTALKALNRMHDDTRGVRISGRIEMGGIDIHHPSIDPPVHRRRFGWVAQKPNPFPMSVYENVAYGIRIHGLAHHRTEIDHRVQDCLVRAGLWDEVKDVLHSREGTSLSGGQQQRLCIARALSTDPEVLLMDEPTGSIDPVATARVETLMTQLAEDHAIVVVTHSMMEARRIAHRVACFHMGRLVEIGPTRELFLRPKTDLCRGFIAGRMG
jgi:phosphate transport system ATP-binding protein